MNATLPQPTAAELIKQAMDALGGEATAEELVDYAKPKHSPIHHLFEWDNKTAGHLYRLDQARHWIRSVKVTYQAEDAEEKSGERAFTAVYAHEDAPSRTYMPTGKVMSTEELAEQAMAEAESGLRGWQRRYQFLANFPKFQTRFGSVVKAIEALKP